MIRKTDKALLTDREIPADRTRKHLRNKRENHPLLRAYLLFLVRLSLTAVLLWVLFAKVFLITQAPDNSMFPAVKHGDLLIAFRLQKDMEKNEIAVCTVDGKRTVLRILARENDTVKITEDGILSVNGSVQTGEILFPTIPADGKETELRIPEGHVFVLGDYRIEAEDSRSFGPLPADQIEGIVITLLRRQAL